MCDGKVTEQSSRQHRTVDCFMGQRAERLTVSALCLVCCSTKTLTRERGVQKMQRVRRVDKMMVW